MDEFLVITSGSPMWGYCYPYAMPDDVYRLGRARVDTVPTYQCFLVVVQSGITGK